MDKRHCFEFWFVGFERVSDEGGEDVDGGIGWGSVSCVVDVCFGFKDVEDGFDEEALTSQDFFIDRHEVIFHALSDTGDQLESALIEALEQFGRDIAFVGTQQSFQIGGHGIGGSAVIDVAACDLCRHKLSFVVYDDVQLEAVEPSHAAFAALGHAVKHAVTLNTPVVTYRQMRGIHEINAGFFTHQRMQQQVQRQKQPRHQRDEPVVAHQAGEIAAMPIRKIRLIKPFEVLARRQMEYHHDRQHLAQS